MAVERLGWSTDRARRAITCPASSTEQQGLASHCWFQLRVYFVSFLHNIVAFDCYSRLVLRS